MTGVGVVDYGVYLPRHRLARAAIGTSLGLPPGAGTRTVAGYDEDATSMGVEAARHALSDGATPRSVYFATTTPPYADKTNAAAIHAALDLPEDTFAVDLGASVRGAVGALRAAARSGGLAVLADIRIGQPGSADERDGGDGAAAFVLGAGDGVVAEILAESATTSETLDRWRRPGDFKSQVWEERFGVHRYLPLIERTVANALQLANVDVPDHIVVSSPQQRLAATLLKRFPPASTAANALQRDVGFAGAADVGLKLAAALDAAAPGQTILLVSVADGCDAIVLRATDALAARAQRPGLAEQLGAGADVAYTDFLTWRGVLVREPPRRPEPPVVAGPPAARNERWKFSFTGTRCGACDTLHVPPQRVCVTCGTTDQMTDESLAQRQGTIATYAIDRLAHSLAPPVVDAVIDFDGGGRRQCQLTDVTPEDLQVGGRVELTFRRMHTSGDVHNYFWKARPVRETATVGRDAADVQ